MRTLLRLPDHPAVRLAGPFAGLACAGVFLLSLDTSSVEADSAVVLDVAVLAPVALLWVLLTARARWHAAPARAR